MARSSVRGDYLQDDKLRAADEQDIVADFGLNQVEANGTIRVFLCSPNEKNADAKLQKRTITPDLRLSLKGGLNYFICYDRCRRLLENGAVSTS